jgi:GNAT superfamily N-acetyltransferase
MSGHGSATSPRGGDAKSKVSGISLVRDHQACVPLTRILGDGDLLVLLSPVVVPFQLEGNSSSNRDPFEPFGRALAKRHPWTRHVPYTSSNGITGYHVTFIKRAKAVIFIISGAPIAGQSSQVEIADVARMIGEHRPQIIVACQDVRDLSIVDSSFPTILQLPGYAPKDLEHAAALLFGEVSSTASGSMNVQELIMAPRPWEVEALPESLAAFDISPVLELWNECLPDKFRMNGFALHRLLDRDGFGRHYVVRLPDTSEIVGFCATYTTWAFSDPEYLVGSLAMLVVRQAYRRRGIGRSLHDHAIDQMTRTRGVRRLLLGSTFPRLLCGIPRELVSHEWFNRRGWPIDSHSAGRGREISDWLLRIQDWPGGGFATFPEGFTFRPCTLDEFPTVLQFVRSEAARNETMGLFEEYKWSKDFANDIVLGIHGKTIVAAALLYLPNSGSTAENDLPWAGVLGSDVGGITCICIAGKFIPSYCDI